MTFSDFTTVDHVRGEPPTYVAKDLPDLSISPVVRFDPKIESFLGSNRRQYTPLPEIEKSECELGHIGGFF